MSLIQEALKRKREEEALRPQQAAPSPPPPRQVPPPADAPEPVAEQPSVSEKKPKEKLLPAVLLIAVLFLIVLGLHYYFLTTRSAPGRAARPAPAISKKPAPPPIPSVRKEIGEPLKEGWPAISVDGFAATGGKMMVIINGRLKTAGREVEGVRIVEVTEDEVTLEYQKERYTVYALDD